jgi:hypothetical protein
MDVQYTPPPPQQTACTPIGPLSLQTCAAAPAAAAAVPCCRNGLHRRLHRRGCQPDDLCHDARDSSARQRHLIRRADRDATPVAQEEEQEEEDTRQLVDTRQLGVSRGQGEILGV